MGQNATVPTTAVSSAVSGAVSGAVSATDSIDLDQVLKASRALLAHLKKESAQKPGTDAKRDLLAVADPDAVLAETPIWLTITTKRHIADSNRLKPAKIHLRHPLNPTTDDLTSPRLPASTICLITADPQRDYKDLVASDEFPAALRARITRVIGFAKLKAKFRQYEAQRALFAGHDIFLADERIVNRLPAALGKTFYKSTTKRPVPVFLSAKPERLDGKEEVKDKKKKKKKSIAGGAKAGGGSIGKPGDIAAELEKAVGSALVSLSQSTNAAVKIGYASWTPEHVADNAAVVAEAFVQRFVPQKWRNLKSMYIKSPTSAALPIWLTGELWTEDGDVIADRAGEDEEENQLGESREKANVGKKRKAMADGDEAKVRATPDSETAKRTKKAKAKKPGKALPLPESNDDRLDREISKRKEKLKRQKVGARSAAIEN